MPNDIISSPYNPIHFTYIKQADPSFHYKDYHDDTIGNRVDRYRMNVFYSQKWQNGDPVILEFITMGIAQVELRYMDMYGKLYASFLSTTVNDPSLLPPYSLKQFNISLSAFAVGCYQVEMWVSGVKLMRSVWQQVAVDWPETLAFDYFHYTNKLDGYFSQFKPRFRVEGFIQTAEPSFKTTHYSDEPGDSETLYGVVTKKRIMKIGNDFGVPEWVHIKLSEIFMLSNVMIENIGFSLTEGAQIKIEKQDDYPLYWSSFEIEYSKNRGMAVTNSAIPVSINIATINIDAGSVGIGTGVTQVNVN